MSNLLQQLITSERGQDVIEYALLTAAMGIVGIATWPLIANAVGERYGEFDQQTQDLWVVPDPAGL